MTCATGSGVNRVVYVSQTTVVSAAASLLPWSDIIRSGLLESFSAGPRSLLTQFTIHGQCLIFITAAFPRTHAQRVYSYEEEVTVEADRGAREGSNNTQVV